MRAKKVVLCVAADEAILSMRSFLLETRGYRVIRAQTAAQALELLALEASWGRGVDLLLLHLPLDGAEQLLDESKRSDPYLNTGGTSDVLGYDERIVVGNYRPKGTWSPAELVEMVKNLTARKRGPRQPLPPEVPKKPSVSVRGVEAQKKGVA